MEKSMKGLVCALGALSLATVQAKTIALWPLTTDRITGETYGHSVINPQDDLSAGVNVTSRPLTLGWNLPPNPDTSIEHPRFDPCIWGEFYGNDVKAKGGIFASSAISTELATALLPNHDFTVEGWVRFGKTPGWEAGTDEWWVIAYANNGSNSDGGWNLTLRRVAQGLKWIHFQKNGVNDLQIGETIDNFGEEGYAEKEAAFLNRWMHLALVFQYTDPQGSGKSVWTLYVDGVKAGSVSQNQWSGSLTARTFDLGGRGNSDANRARLASFAYWRVSDEALDPTQFLNAGDAGTMVPQTVSSTTRMYWKLGRGANGGLDTSASVGGVTLHGCLFGETANLLSATSPSAECAFTGNPPNPNVTLLDGNVGSVKQDCQASFLQAKNLGRHLTLTNSFTVEGWVRPRRMRTTDANGQYIFNTRRDNGAWACQLWQRGESWYLEIFAQDSSGTTVAASTRISPDLRDWYDWKHLALVYDVDGGDGKGEWRAYLDGTLSGTVVNTAKPAGDTYSIDFFLGGRPGNTSVFYGNLDCFRVSKAALAPSQFMNATTDAQAATDVLALWPLNAQNGAYFDCADVVGGYHLVNKRDPKHLAAPVDAAPVVSNPDTTATFLGDPAHSDGSTGFQTIGGLNSYLATTRSDVRDLFCSGTFTLEGYFRRTQAVSASAWELLFGTTAKEDDSTKFTNIGLGGASMQINFTYRSNGFVLFASPSGHNDVVFPNTAGAMPLNEWQHVALSCRVAEGTATWKLYLNGELRGTLTGNCTGIPKPGCFLVGGRPHSANSFKGAISNVRFSLAALEPGQFLCDANTAAPTEPETLAYWPFDVTGAQLDVTSRLLPAYNLVNLPHVTGSAERAAARPGLPDDSAAFQGDPRINTGSVSFADGHGNTFLLGDKLDLTGPFTIEGWVKWSHAVANGLEYFLGTYRYTATQCGWRLCFDTTGDTPRLRIFARGYNPVSVCVDACFDVDVSFLENTWTHLALTYDNRVGNGVWTLFADGQQLGTVENLWSPNAGTFSHNLFKFGEIGDATVHGFTGLLDMWRVSKGVRTPATFLYQKPRAFFFFVR